MHWQHPAAELSGLNNQMWATIVNRDGAMCALAFSGANRGAQWPGSRIISAQKANTANAFSLDSPSAGNGSGQAAGLALSSANLFSAVQLGDTLYSLQHSNPVDTGVAYAGPSSSYGLANDPMVGHKIGGVNARRRPGALSAGHGIVGAAGNIASGFGHPTCLNNSGSAGLPACPAVGVAQAGRTAEALWKRIDRQV